MENNNIITESVIRKPEDRIKPNEKKHYVARYIEMLVKQGKNIEEHVAKPLNWYDHEKVHKIVTEWDEKNQLKLNLENENNTEKGTTVVDNNTDSSGHNNRGSDKRDTNKHKTTV